MRNGPTVSCAGAGAESVALPISPAANYRAAAILTRPTGPPAFHRRPIRRGLAVGELHPQDPALFPRASGVPERAGAGFLTPRDA